MIDYENMPMRGTLRLEQVTAICRCLFELKLIKGKLLEQIVEGIPKLYRKHKRGTGWTGPAGFLSGLVMDLILDIPEYTLLYGGVDGVGDSFESLIRPMVVFELQQS